MCTKLKKLSKKILFTLFFTLILASCASINQESTNKINLNESEIKDIQQKEKIISNIAKMICQGEIESAFYRMDNLYRQQISFTEFSKIWEDFIEKNGPIQNFTIDSSCYQDLDFYKSINVTYHFEATSIDTKYLFKATALSPVDLITNYQKDSSQDSDLALKDLCKDYFKLGCGLTGASLKNSALKVPKFMDIVKAQFSSCTSTNLMKPHYVLNQVGSINNHKKGKNQPYLSFKNIDETLTWCQKNKVPLRGHTLVWHTQTPDWFFKEGFETNGELVSRQVMIERLDSFIKQYMTYVQEKYPDTVYCWDVVNEAVDPENGDPNTNFMCRRENSTKKVLWYETIGPDYPEVAFTIARKYAAPGVKLFYNDYGTIGYAKRSNIYNLCESLKEKNLIDGIGLQGYWDLKNPDLQEIEEAINHYAQLGLEIQLTEWSISVKETSPEAFNLQAERYASVLRLLQKLDTQGGGNANITCVSFFGVMDGFPLNSNDTTTSRLYDKNFQEKPAYFCIKDIFKLFY